MDAETKSFIPVIHFIREKYPFQTLSWRLPLKSYWPELSHISILGLVTEKEHQTCSDWFRPIITDPPLQSRLNRDKIGIPLARKKGERLFIKHVGSYVCHGTVLSCISLLVQTGSSLKEQGLCLFHLGTTHVSYDKVFKRCLQRINEEAHISWFPRCLAFLSEQKVDLMASVQKRKKLRRLIATSPSRET